MQSARYLLGALGVAVACGGGGEDLGSGESCYRDSECGYGLVCAIPRGGDEWVCTRDVSGLVSQDQPDLGGDTGGGDPADPGGGAPPDPGAMGGGGGMPAATGGTDPGIGGDATGGDATGGGGMGGDAATGGEATGGEATGGDATGGAPPSGGTGAAPPEGGADAGGGDGGAAPAGGDGGSVSPPQGGSATEGGQADGGSSAAGMSYSRQKNFQGLCLRSRMSSWISS